MGDVKIIKCNCEQKYQDKVYGDKKRVGNPCVKEGQYRCTGCGKVVSV